MGDQEQDVFGSESGGDGADAAEKPSSLLEMTEEANADKEDHEEKEDKEEVHQVMKRPSSKVMKRPSSAPGTKSANNSDKEEKSVKKDKSEKKGKEDKSEKKDKKDKSEKKDKETKPPMKRPATTRLEKMAELFEFQEDEAADDDGEKEDDAMEGGGEGEEIDGRDRSKSRRFHQMLKAGSLPAAALEAWQKASTRAEQTTLINTCLKKDGKKYIIKPEFSTPSSYQMDKNMSKQERAQDIQEGFGKLIFQKKYGLSDDELNSCLSSGEVLSPGSMGDCSSLQRRTSCFPRPRQRQWRKNWKASESSWMRKVARHSAQSSVACCLKSPSQGPMLRSRLWIHLQQHSRARP